MDHKFRFSVSHEKNSKWQRGLRAFFDYRDLGVQEATGGRVLAHVIRAIPGVHAILQRHHHNLEFQMIYVLKGWIRFDYEGVGEVTLTAGSCAHQPPGIRHTELAHSDDLELLEIAMPANVQTEND